MGFFSKKDKKTAKHNDTSIIMEILKDKVLCTMIIGFVLVVLSIGYKILFELF